MQTQEKKLKNVLSRLFKSSETPEIVNGAAVVEGGAKLHHSMAFLAKSHNLPVVRAGGGRDIYTIGVSERNAIQALSDAGLTNKSLEARLQYLVSQPQ